MPRPRTLARRLGSPRPRSGTSSDEVFDFRFEPRRAMYDVHQIQLNQDVCLEDAEFGDQACAAECKPCEDQRLTGPITSQHCSNVRVHLKLAGASSRARVELLYESHLALCNTQP